MAHLVSPEVFTPGFMSRSIVTEDTQRELKDFTAEDVHFILHLLAYNNSRVDTTCTQLERYYNLKIHPSTLRSWVSSAFTEKYVAIQHELSEAINKRLSANMVDIAAKAAEATDKALDHGLGEIGNLKPHEVAAAAKNYADTMSKTIEKSQLLQDRPTNITKHVNPDEALEVLRGLGLLEERVVDAEVVEELEG